MFKERYTFVEGSYEDSAKLIRYPSFLSVGNRYFMWEQCFKRFEKVGEGMNFADSWSYNVRVGISRKIPARRSRKRGFHR